MSIDFSSHDTQTTHWDSPVGARQHKHLTILQEYTNKVKNNMEVSTFLICCHLEMALQDLEQELNDKRKKLVNLNADAESDDDSLDDIMLLNNEVEQLDDHVTLMRQHLQCLVEMNRRAQIEDVNEQVMVENCYKDANELVKVYKEFKSGQSQLHKCLEKAENSDSGSPDMGLAYLLQMPPLQNNEEIGDTISCLHLLPDRITAKTSLELAVEIKLMVIAKQRLSELHQLIQLQSTRQMGDMAEEISRIELPEDQWINLNFR